jgi:hypothetical protein
MAVRRFTEELNTRLRQCDNGEGMICNNLDESINYYVGLCAALRAYVNNWARAIFTGQVAFDQAVEDALKEEVRRLLHRAKQVAARGRAMDGECYVLQGLNPLHRHIADFDYLLENWVSPRLAISPAPRVKLAHAAESGSGSGQFPFAPTINLNEDDMYVGGPLTVTGTGFMPMASENALAFLPAGIAGYCKSVTGTTSMQVVFTSPPPADTAVLMTVTTPLGTSSPFVQVGYAVGDPTTGPGGTH